MTPTSYTRAGNFSINSEGFLTTQTGQYVLGFAQPQGATPPTVAIQVPAGATGLAIDQSGGLSYIDPAHAARVTAVPHHAGDVLERRPASSARARNQWVASANSGVKTQNTPGVAGLGVTTAGAIEMSNVDLSQTFTNMITAQRGFQANSRVISTADEMLQDLVNLKR